ncbi:MAG: hypothetical protein Q9170_002389 [Blastenia crenularia]
MLLPSLTKRSGFDSLTLLFIASANLVHSNSLPAKSPNNAISNLQTIAINPKIAPNPDTSIALPSLSASLPPPDFSLIPISGAIYLEPRLVWWLTTSVYTQLVKSHFDGRIDKRSTQRSTLHPGAALILNGPGPEGGYDVKHMVWGLTLAAKYIVDNNEIRNRRFTLKRGQEYVGTIWYWWERSRLEVGSDNSTSVFVPDDSFTIASGTAGEKNDLPEVILNYNSWDRHAGLTLNIAMIAIIGALSDIAPHDLQKPVTDIVTRNIFISQFPPYPAKLRLHSPLPGQAREKLSYYAVYAVLLKLAEWYLTHEDGKSVQIEVKQGRQVIGIGYFVG